MRNGRQVYFNPAGRAATHLTDTPQLYELVADFLARQEFHEPAIFLDHNAGSVVGMTDMVETNDADDIVYAKRLNRDTYTRFAKNRLPSTTTYFTVALQQDERGDYELVSAWIGRVCPNFPDEPNATSESRPFWATHALAWGTQTVQEGTETSVCPW